MADIIGKKISELPEVTEIEGTYTVVSNRNTKSGKLSLKFLKEVADYANRAGDYANQIANQHAANVGLTEYPTFDAAGIYNSGEVVIYDGGLYRFTAPHHAGEWNGNDVVRTSIKAEVERRVADIYIVLSESEYKELQVKDPNKLYFTFEEE